MPEYIVSAIIDYLNRDWDSVFSHLDDDDMEYIREELIQIVKEIVD